MLDGLNKEPNSYSKEWFDVFHRPIGEERTNREVEFVCAMAALPAFRNVLDICCGTGWHARALAERGYSVTGIERDRGAIAKAREAGGGPDYVLSDVRDYDPAASVHDLAIVMGQSFGYFDSATNRELLARLAKALRRGGRIILDVWNPEFFAVNQGDRNLETPSGIVREKKSIADGRLFVHLTYPKGAMENFEWELFDPMRMHSLAKPAGLVLAIACTNFEADTKPNAANPRIQFVLEKS
jgi:D-alanine-D-alanine ligase